MKNAAQAWTAADEAMLRQVYAETEWRELEKYFGRSQKAIKSRAGALKLHRGTQHLHLTDAQLELLKARYPDSDTKELADRLGLSVTSVHQRAQKLGVSKSDDFMRRKAIAEGQRLAATGASNRFGKGHVPANKGLRRPGWSAGRMAETQFKKGARAGEAQRRWCPVGTVKMRDGYLVMKVKDEPESIAGKGAHSTNWMYVHRMVWESANGMIPAGHRIWWKDRNHENCAIENLELLSDVDHMARTTVHNLPPELKQVVQLTGALRRKISNRLKKEREADDGRGEGETETKLGRTANASVRGA